MFSELPKLLDRDFAVGYFLPVVFFVTANLFLLPLLGLGRRIADIAVTDTLVGTTVIGLVSWTIGVFLMVTNREITRVLEGYGTFNPVRLFTVVEKYKYKRLKEKMLDIGKKYYEFEDAGKEVPEKLISEQRKLLVTLAEQYPPNIEWIMPTPFGNVFRAFETYPGYMYGIEAVEGWGRLQPLIPEIHQKQINSAKSIVDFWVNLGLLSSIFFVEVCVLRVVLPAKLLINLLAATSLFITWISAYRATSSAIDWGETIKSSFDLYLIDLAKKVGLEIPADRAREKELWTAYSQSFVFEMPELLPNRNESRKEDKLE